MRHTNTQANDAPYLWQLIGVAAVILLGTPGITAVMAWMPSPTDAAAAAFVLDMPRAPPARPDAAEAQILPARAEDARPSVKCAECGVVESTREIEQPGEGTEPGAAGAVARGDRRETTDYSIKTYEVTVRMSDGSHHVFMDAKRANWRPGARVIVIQGANQSNH